ncbi:MAG: hypothetical protein IJ228_10995 [Succinivibrio sp.]|nr:hypothetical protein [Succinivibrio sp.]
MSDEIEAGVILGFALVFGFTVLATIIDFLWIILSEVLLVLATCGLYFLLVKVFEELDRSQNDRA